MNVGQVMTRGPRACGPKDSMSFAAQIMWENDCGCVPVVDESGKAIAMITDRDVCMAAYTRGLPLAQMQVDSAASQSIVSVRESDSIDLAESLMQQHRIRRLAVIDDDGRLIGILSMNDLARRAHPSQRHGDVHPDAIVRTLAAVCAHAGAVGAAE